MELDERILEALEDLLEQGKGKVDADAEEEDDASLSLDNLSGWGEQDNLLVLIRGYCKLLKDEGKQPEAEVLRLAQIIERERMSSMRRSMRMMMVTVAMLALLLSE